MSLAVIKTRALLGVDSPQVLVEVHLSNGLPAFNIVGLPEAAVKESKDRVRSALINSHFDFPQRRITVNLAPADLPKEGGRYDLAIALGILAASEQVAKGRLDDHEFIGELALSGELRPVKGCIPSAIACHQNKHTLVVPSANAAEGTFCQQNSVLLAPNLLTMCAYLNNSATLDAAPEQKPTKLQYDKDLVDVRGQLRAKRALEIAATGGHNLLLIGPPGTGKSMLASRLPSILPPMEEEEALEVASIQSISQLKTARDWHIRPFRAPHHTSSAIALVGGGSQPKPGEISLAHNGVLFLDELPEFSRHVLEVLREPLENGHICISRASAQVEYPANFQLITAMNPCPCGYFGDNTDRCRCTPPQVNRYRDKISGPLLDRIDLHVHVDVLPIHEMQSPASGENSDTVRGRVIPNRQIQLQRQGSCNAKLSGKALSTYCQLGPEEQEYLSAAITRLNLSARAYDRVLKVARTIADMARNDMITCSHLGEALSYRHMDRALL